jgi:ABC-2 type transport system ATP-binding protein
MAEMDLQARVSLGNNRAGCRFSRPAFVIGFGLIGHGAVIEIIELYKYYGERRAVGPLSAEIQDGEIVGLLGLNGAGKTTTLRILTCDLLPTSGTVRVDGIDVVDNPNDVRARTGYLSESTPLYAEMTVNEFLAFAARLRGVPAGEVEKRVDEAIAVTKTTKVRDQVIGTLSHGYKQRTGIAQAIVHNPSLVVLDEPIAGLDPQQIVGMRRLVKSLGGKHTVLVSSHNLSEISETCDRILVITDGRVSAAGSAAELAARLLGGMRVRVTVRQPPALDAKGLEALVAAVPGVRGVEAVVPDEGGERVVSLAVDATSDVREELGRALVGAGAGLLELGRTERALESVFLELAASEDEGHKPGREVS